VTIERAIEAVQFAYPQVYYACHTRHARRRSGHTQVSSRDGEMLVHLSRERPTTVSTLAAHLQLARSTVSEALTKLERYGYVSKSRTGDGDRRHVGILLTPKGVDVVKASSVLDAARLGAVLGRLSSRQRTDVVLGLTGLADACLGRRPR